MKKLLTALFLFSFLPFQMRADHDVCQRSTEGTDFWFGFMEGRNYNQNGHFLQITVTSSFDTNFTITYGTNATVLGTYAVAANSSEIITINNWIDLETIGSEFSQEKGIHLVSDNPVNVYALNWDNKSADVAVIYPQESIGEEYFVMCYEPHVSEDPLGSGSYYNGRNSEFLIVATEDNTQVEITPSVETDRNKPAGIPFSIFLNRGQTYQVQSLNRILPNQGDLTGSHITADKPLAVYSGNLATSVPNIDPIDAWDHLYEQMPPLYSWGKEYYAVPLRGRQADRYRILASEDGTTVSVDGFAPIQLDAGEFEEILLTKDQPSRILGNKPIMVAQFSQSQTVDGTQGDPSMIMLSSTSQSKNDVTFEAYSLPSIATHYINIISLTDQVANMRLDGQTFQNLGYSFNEFPGTNYSYAQLPLNTGTHTLKNTDPDQGFLAYVYGFGDKESFGYGVGFNLNVVLDLGESIDFDGDTLLLCAGDTLTLDAGPYFDTYYWSTEDTSQSIRVTEEGMYKVTTTVGDCPALYDSVYVLYNNPQLKIVPDQFYDCFPSETTLRADAPEAVSFLWESKEGDSLTSNQTLVVDSTALYLVTVQDSYGCAAVDTADVIIFGRPPVTIHADSLVCGDLQTTITADLGSYPDSLWTTAPGGFKWASNDDDFVTFIDETDSLAVMSVTRYGTFEVYYELMTKDSCFSGDTIEVRFFPGPEFAVVPNQYYACSPASIELQADISSDPTGVSYLWQTLEGDTLGTDLTLPVDSTALYLLSIENAYGCTVTDTADVIIFGNPPVTIHADTAQCGELSTIVNVDFANYPDSLWDYPGSFQWFSPSPDLVVSDSIDASATVTAVAPGNYDLYYKLTTKDNCVSGDTIKVRFITSAEFNIVPDQYSTCAPDSVELTADITSDPAEVVSYLWQTTEGDTLGFGQTPTLWVDSTALYLLTVENQDGCTLTDTADVIIFGNPPVTIYADAAQCGMLSTMVHVDFANYPDSLWKTPPGGFTWDTNGLTLTNETDSSATVSAQGYGTYEVYYVLRTKDGCESGDTIQIRFNPQPTASFNFNFQPYCTDYIDTLEFTGLASDSASFNWSFTNVHVIDTLAPNLFSVGADVFVDGYTVNKPSIRLVIDDAGCRDTAYLEEPDTLDDERKQNIDFTAEPLTGCDSLETMLIVTSLKEDSNIKWFTDIGNYSHDSLRLTFRDPGFYDITMYAESKISGCIEERTKEDFLEVSPPPVAAFEIDHQNVSLQDPTVSFYNRSDYADAFTWIFGDGERSNLYETSHTYPGLGTYLASLKASSDGGCSDSTSTLIHVVLDHIYAPNAFRPNSDIPENRVFMPYGLGLNSSNFILQIYDRWGQVVFESTSTANSWEGLDKNGKEAPMGNYIWTATYSDIEGREHQQNGQVLLVR